MWGRSGRVTEGGPLNKLFFFTLFIYGQKEKSTVIRSRKYYFFIYVFRLVVIFSETFFFFFQKLSDVIVTTFSPVLLLGTHTWRILCNAMKGCRLRIMWDIGHRTFQFPLLCMLLECSCGDVCVCRRARPVREGERGRERQVKRLKSRYPRKQ